MKNYLSLKWSYWPVKCSFDNPGQYFLRLNWTVFIQCPEKNSTQIFIPMFFQWTRRMQFSPLGQITFDKSRTFFRLVYECIWILKLFQKIFPFKLFSWTCELKFWQTRRRFFFQIRKIFFQRPFLFSSKLSYWHVECILITRLNFVRQNPRIIRSWSEKKDRITTCRMPSCQLRRKFENLSRYDRDNPAQGPKLMRVKILF